MGKDPLFILSPSYNLKFASPKPSDTTGISIEDTSGIPLVNTYPSLNLEDKIDFNGGVMLRKDLMEMAANNFEELIHQAKVDHIECLHHVLGLDAFFFGSREGSVSNPPIKKVYDRKKKSDNRILEA
ncbi:hypothetical protein CR513_02445, partial [Mucuna pruriens]